MSRVRWDSRIYNKYGPFMIKDISGNYVVAWGISDLDTLEAELPLAADPR